MGRHKTKTYYVYIMSSPSRTLYTGVTNDLERRVAEHKSGEGGQFTQKYKVNALVYFEEFADITQAIERESSIKGLLRSKRIALIESVNPHWRDLSLPEEDRLLRCAQNDTKLSQRRQVALVTSTEYSESSERG